MFKLNQTHAEQMNLNKSYIVITHKDFLLPELSQTADVKEQISDVERIADAQKKAEYILTEARRKSEDMRKNAWKDGFEEGKAAAEKEASDFIREQANEARAVFSNLERYKQELYRDLQENVLALSFDIAEKIVNVALQKDDKLYIGIVEKAIENLKSTEKFVLRVGRTEYDKFFRDGAQWLRDETGCMPFEVVCDPQMGEGGCILESGDRMVNAGVKLQLSKIAHLLTEKIIKE